MFLSGFLDVSGGHSVYYEVHGCGTACAVILHGGPGGGFDPSMLRIYDLTQWRVLVFDQRGCGKSRPFLELKNNTTWDLVEDIEALRTQVLHVDKWFVSGGSWGTTLALAYAEKYPLRVSGLLLRGLCFSDEAAMRWLYEEGGASEVYPEAWDKFIAVLPSRLHRAGWMQIARYFHKRLADTTTVARRLADTMVDKRLADTTTRKRLADTTTRKRLADTTTRKRLANTTTRKRLANAWWDWEAAVSHLVQIPDNTTPTQALALATIENHYFVNRCWLKEGELLRGLSKLKHIPITIVHGRYDMVCPISAVHQFKKALPHTRIIITLAGHAATEQETFAAQKMALKTTRRRTVKRSTL